MPQSLLLNTTTFCNARCAFCIVLDRLDRPELNMTDEQIDAALTKARAEGSTEVGYSGGEPSVDPRLVSIIQKARAMGFTHQSMNTNGIKLRSAAYCRELVEAGITSIDFSIHGHTDELHDALVARKGALAAIREACGHLRLLQKEFKFHLSATVVITRTNHHELVAIAKLNRELGIAHVRLKYAYEGPHTIAAIIEQVAPYQEVVPSVVAAIDYLASTPGGLAITHVPLCLLGHRAAFSQDIEQRPAMMAFADLTSHGDASQRFRQDGDDCSACAVSNLCTRLDAGYEKFHGRPVLKPFASHDAVEAMFEEAMRAYPGRVTHLTRIRETWRGNRDAARSASVFSEPLAPFSGAPVKLTVPRPKPAT